MNILAAILAVYSTLIYAISAQQCSNSHSQRLMISVSINGRSVDKIGRTTYLSAINEALDTILPSSNTQAALYTFGGVTVSGVGTESTNQVTALGTHTYSSLSSTITGLETSASWDNNLGNAVGAIISEATTVIGTPTTSQRYHIIFSAGNPLANGFGDTTSPLNPNDPCFPSIASKAAGIQTFVVLIGEDGYNFMKEFYECVGESIDDVIVMDPASTSAALTELDTKMCKTNGDDLKITEINLVAGTNSGAQFVEVLNRGAATTITACLGTSCQTSGTITTGSYYTAYTSYTVSGTSHTATAEAGGIEIDSVVYSEGSNGFQNPLTDRSLELRNIGFDNDYGANWRQACAGVYSTADAGPVEVCTAVDSSCGVPGQATTSCNINDGFSGVTCQTGSGQYCECPAGVGAMPDIDTCTDYCSCFLPYRHDCARYTVPVPTTCQAYVVPYTLVTGDRDYIYFTFDKVEFGGDISYRVQYYDSSDASQTAEVRKHPVVATDSWSSDYIDQTGSTGTITVTVVYNAPIWGQTFTAASSALSCPTTTLEPTASPTQDPTSSPSRSPSGSPTPAPTYDQPGVAFKKVCGPFRCSNCFGTDRDCCLPYGPGKTPGFSPNDGCSQITTTWELLDSNPITKEISFGVFPEDFSEDVTVTYSIKSYGEINITEFEALTWADSYATDGTIVDVNINTTLRRRLFEQEVMAEHEAKLANVQRRLLQNTTTTPAPTTQYGNRLNILIEPPGQEDTLYTDSLTISGLSGTDGENAEASIYVNVSSATLKCEADDPDCITFEECQSKGMAFVVAASECSSSSGFSCTPMYPYLLWVIVTRSSAQCEVALGFVDEENPLPWWWWILLIAFIVFLLCLAWLVYRFWWSQKKTAEELGTAEDELDQQHADNEAGFGKDLDVGDVAFNPMATGVPGMNRPADAFGNELHQRELEQQNDMVDVQAEIFQVREEYGQVATDGQQRHNY